MLRRRPLVIVEPGGCGDTVLDSSVEAEGICAGMTLREALQKCGSATVVQADRRHYDKVDDQIARALGRRCGHVERDGLGRMYVTLHAAGAPYGEAHLVSTLSNAVPEGIGPRVGVGPGRFISYALARAAPDGGTLRAPLDPQAFLRTRPVDLLPLAREKIVRLRASGLMTLGSLADLVYSDLHALLGTDAQLARDLALGIDPVLPSEALRPAA